MSEDSNHELGAALERLRASNKHELTQVRAMLFKAADQYTQGHRELHDLAESARHLGPNIASIADWPELRQSTLWSGASKKRDNINDLVAIVVEHFLDARGPNAAASLLVALHPLVAAKLITEQAYRVLSWRVLSQCLTGAPQELAKLALNATRRPRARRKDLQRIEQAKAYVRLHPRASDREMAREIGISPTTVGKWRRDGVLPPRQEED